MVPGVLELQKKLFDRGLHIKTTGNSALLSPPFASRRDNLDFMIEALHKALKHLAADARALRRLRSLD